jgi:hypothetical protein
VLIAAAALSLAGCLGDGQPGPGSRAASSCLEAPQPRRPTDGRPAVVALLGDFDRYPSELGLLGRAQPG